MRYMAAKYRSLETHLSYSELMVIHLWSLKSVIGPHKIVMNIDDSNNFKLRILNSSNAVISSLCDVA